MFIIIGLVVLLLILFAEQFMNGGPREGGVTFSEVDGSGWGKAFTAALICGTVAFFAPKLFCDSIWLIIMLVALIIMLASLCVEWHRNKYPDMFETVPCIILAWIIGGLTIYTATRIDRGTIFDAMSMWAAIAMTVLTVLYIVVAHLARNHELGWLLPVFAVFAIVAMLGSSIGTGAFAASMAAREQTADAISSEEQAVADVDTYVEGLTDEEVAEEKAVAGDVEEARASGDIHFYNDDVQGGTVDDDFDYGPNPWVDGKDAGYYHDDFAARRARDPALLAGTMLALDATYGTDFIGETLYEGYDERLNMLKRANAASRVLTTNRTIFMNGNDAVNKFFRSAKKIELRKVAELKDQVYMYNATLSGIPGLVVYESDVDSGWCLIYTFEIKGSEESIAFHIPCGYQWTNASEKINVEPTKKPTKTKTPKKPEKPEKPDKPEPEPEPEPEPDPKPEYDKDPSKAPDKNTEPNDDKGPGPDTNNKKDKNHSKEDSKDSTTNQTHDETKKEQKDKADTNKNQKTGNDDNKPSTTPSKQDTKSDNNGDAGKINEPTKTKETGTAAGQDNDGTISVPD